MRETFTLGELFCGPGGMSLGASLANVQANGKTYSFQSEWANDIDPDAIATQRLNVFKDNEDAAVCGDVRDFLPRCLNRPVDGFAYGFPCNDFSVVGERKGFSGDYGPLYAYGVKVLEALRPKFFVAENVGGLLTADGGESFKKILSDLSAAGGGYSVTAHLYHAEDYGVPQRRHRVILVGMHCSTGKVFKVPAPTHSSPVGCREAIETPPILPDAPNHEFASVSPAVRRRLEHIKPGENAWTADLPEELKLHVKSARLSQIYKRLDPGEPSYTITGCGGGGTHVYHWKEPRALTNRERARLQSFPDDFVFAGGVGSVRKQVGMAVPPMLAKTVFEAVLNTLVGAGYPCVSASICGGQK